MADRPACVIAVVDDDPAILKSIGNLLESADYAVRLHSSADALIASDGLREIDCLVSDISMPGMSGIELLQVVHAARPGLPVIVVSGQPDVCQRLTSLATRHYHRLFRKPFSGDELLAAIGSVLQDRCSRTFQS
jgi:FixJ family two-component response regulator